jgi:hypothetical protein
MSSEQKKSLEISKKTDSFLKPPSSKNEDAFFDCPLVQKDISGNSTRKSNKIDLKVDTPFDRQNSTAKP